MRKRVLVVLVGVLLAIGMPSIALGGAAFTMHPAGSGQKTYASWKANVGEPDSNVNGTQAIFMQKNSSGDTSAVVVIRGLAGQPVSALQSLYWDRPMIGRPGSHCGSSPHWQMSVTDSSGTTNVAFGPCFGQPKGTAQVSGSWTRDICADGCIPVIQDGTINSLAIVFEEPPQDTSPNFVLLDDITVVESNAVVQTWTSASDNGTTTALNIGPALAFADVVSDVLGDLLNLFPGVPATGWTLYPGVDLTPLPTVPAPPTLP